MQEIKFEKPKPFILRIPVKQAGFFYKLLLKFKLVKSSKDFSIDALSLGTVERIAGLIIDIKAVNLLTDENMLENIYTLATESGATLANIISLAVVNRRKSPSKKLIQFFLYNLSIAEMQQALIIIIQQMDIKSFIQAVISVKGIDILSPTISKKDG